MSDPLRELRFDWREAMRRAQRALAEPPPLERIVRPRPRGQLVARFALPLELCKPFNRLGRAGSASAGWALGKLKRNAFAVMLAQNGGRIQRSPLTGRPQVICVRFSSSELDHDSGWSKNPVDRLRVGHNGLGYIVDDKPRHIDLFTRWEPAPPRRGAVLVEVWSG